MNTTEFIGKVVEVCVDRPLGSAHPKWGFRYELNYGYIPGTISGDGEEVDAYILRVDAPLERFEGECIAVIRRTSEADDKLVVVPIGTKRISELEIRRLTHFQEGYFESRVLFIQAD